MFFKNKLSSAHLVSSKEWILEVAGLNYIWKEEDVDLLCSCTAETWPLTGILKGGGREHSLGTCFIQVVFLSPWAPIHSLGPPWPCDPQSGALPLSFSTPPPELV